MKDNSRASGRTFSNRTQHFKAGYRPRFLSRLENFGAPCSKQLTQKCHKASRLAIPGDYFNSMISNDLFSRRGADSC